MLDKLANQIPQILLAQHDEVVKTFLLNRLRPPLSVGVLIRRPHRGPLELDALVLQDLPEVRRELRILIAHDVIRFVRSFVERHAQSFGLTVAIILCFAAAGLGTTPQIPNWYADLAKPTWTPTGWIFGRCGRCST